MSAPRRRPWQLGQHRTAPPKAALKWSKLPVRAQIADVRKEGKTRWILDYADAFFKNYEEQKAHDRTRLLKEIELLQEKLEH